MSSPAPTPASVLVSPSELIKEILKTGLVQKQYDQLRHALITGAEDGVLEDGFNTKVTAIYFLAKLRENPSNIPSQVAETFGWKSIEDLVIFHDIRLAQAAAKKLGLEEAGKSFADLEGEVQALVVQPFWNLGHITNQILENVADHESCDNTPEFSVAHGVRLAIAFDKILGNEVVESSLYPDQDNDKNLMQLAETSRQIVSSLHTDEIVALSPEVISSEDTYEPGFDWPAYTTSPEKLMP